MPYPRLLAHFSWQSLQDPKRGAASIKVPLIDCCGVSDALLVTEGFTLGCGQPVLSSRSFIKRILKRDQYFKKLQSQLESD